MSRVCAAGAKLPAKSFRLLYLKVRLKMYSTEKTTLCNQNLGRLKTWVSPIEGPELRLVIGFRSADRRAAMR